jgi:hypothetical protein
MEPLRVWVVELAQGKGWRGQASGEIPAEKAREADRRAEQDVGYEGRTTTALAGRVKHPCRCRNPN